MIQTIKTFLLIIAVVFVNPVFSGEVSRALFTVGIDGREPVLNVDNIDSQSFTSISFFTELNQMQGHNITHQWTFEDQVMFEKTFEVKGDRWRVWTSKTLIPAWTGTWTVHVLDDDRSVLVSRSFDYQ
ncbi:MAG: DUF2914 domain-containing protein [Pseudomonadota bacterium]